MSNNNCANFNVIKRNRLVCEMKWRKKKYDTFVQFPPVPPLIISSEPQFLPRFIPLPVFYSAMEGISFEDFYMSFKNRCKKNRIKKSVLIIAIPLPLSLSFYCSLLFPLKKFFYRVFNQESFISILISKN